jgi:hypothetical protein
MLIGANVSTKIAGTVEKAQDIISLQGIPAPSFLNN